ncbi:MAG: RNA methyltransferase [Bacteroidales bacterium]|nr:RNA methyltransferase [Bacteroidales bacterium]
MKKLSMEELNRISVEQFKEAEKTPLVVVLDNVRSLNNIGSVFRTSDAFRVAKICLCGITACPPHRDIHKTALGAEDSVDWQYFDNTTDCVNALKEQGYRVYAVEQVDESIMLDTFHTQPNTPTAIVFGNEVEGVDEEVIPLCHGCIEIPQFGTKHSLNISIAAGILIWEMWKKLMSNPS